MAIYAATYNKAKLYYDIESNNPTKIEILDIVTKSETRSKVFGSIVTDQ